MEIMDTQVQKVQNCRSSAVQTAVPEVCTKF
jgi:hypothetical protein